MAKMICPRCGKNNKPGSTFCEQCGNKLVTSVDRSYGGSGIGADRPLVVKKRNNGKKVLAVMIVAAIIAAAAGGGVFVYNHFIHKDPVEIDLVKGFDDTVLDLQGEDKSGIIEGFDEDKIRENLDYYDQSEEVKGFIDLIFQTDGYQTDKKGIVDLCIGEKVTITCNYPVDYAEEHNIKVKNANDGSVSTIIVIENLPPADSDPISSDSGDYNGSAYDANSSDDELSSSDIAECLRSEDDENIRRILTTEYLTEEDISSLSLTETQRLCNYCYAMHGYKIRNNNEDYEYFCSFDWYEPTIEDDDEAAEFFNEFEYDNEKLLGHRRDVLKEQEKKKR